MKNKKALLLPENTVRIVIAVIVIFLLFTVAFKLYGGVTQKSELTQAKSHIDKIEKTIMDLEKKGSGEKDYLLSSPSNWILVSFPQSFEGAPGDKSFGYPNYNIGLDKCEQDNMKSCLCLCESPGYVGYSDNIGNEGVIASIEALARSCNELSECIKINQAEISPRVGGGLKKGTGKIFGVRLDVPADLKISLEGGKLNIFEK